MRAIIKEPYKKAVIKEIEPGLKPLQNLVGGLIENVYELEEQNINIWINEEGKLNDLAPNFLIYNMQDVVVGTAISCYAKYPRFSICAGAIFASTLHNI